VLQFLGKWYVIQKTSTGSKCLTDTYAKTNETGKYVIQQVSEHLILGLTSLNHEYTYEGILSVPESSDPARMVVRFPLSKYTCLIILKPDRHSMVRPAGLCVW
jgi:hypothetical protein